MNLIVLIKEILGSIDKAIKSSLALRSKKELIKIR